jgi:hypothetical protein
MCREKVRGVGMGGYRVVEHHLLEHDHKDPVLFQTEEA